MGRVAGRGLEGCGEGGWERARVIGWVVGEG